MAHSDGVQPNDAVNLNQQPFSPDLGQSNDSANIAVLGAGNWTEPTLDFHLDSEFNNVPSMSDQISVQLQEPNFQLYEPELGQSNDPSDPFFPGIGNPWPEDNPDGLGLHIGALPELIPPEADISPLMSGPYLNIYGGDNTGMEAGWVFRFDGP